jgi:cytoplasmic iron level regulating protein YaaA (DUF328/UPF0246 family)
MKKVALIACVKEKLAYPEKARNIYQSKAFMSWLEWAKNHDALYILSGKHGLLLPEDVIEPYDFNLNHASGEYREKWAKKVIQRLSHLEDFNNTHFSLLCNAVYAKGLLPHIQHWEMPLQIN